MATSPIEHGVRAIDIDALAADISSSETDSAEEGKAPDGADGADGPAATEGGGDDEPDDGGGGGGAVAATLPANKIKLRGWYNELAFYSIVFQFFGEATKEIESMYGWWIILISSLTSFVTLVTVEPFSLGEDGQKYYDWGKSVGLSVLSIATTLIASWMKKKGYVRRIQTTEKRISRLEKFLGKIDYRLRLAPLDAEADGEDPIVRFFEDNRDEYQELSVYTSIISPSEFTETVYDITRFNAPMVHNMWPWYKTSPESGELVADREFAHDIIDAYRNQFSCRSQCVNFWCCREHDDDANPLLRGGRPPAE